MAIGYPSVGIELLGLESPHRAQTRIIRAHITGSPNPQACCVLQRRVQIVPIFVALAGRLAPEIRASQRPEKIDEEMADVMGIAVPGEPVERVGGVELIEAEPRVEHPNPAKVTAMLVRDDVIGVVVARGVELVRAENLGVGDAGGHGAVAVIRGPRDKGEEGVDVLGYQITKVALAGDALGAGGDLELVAIQIDHVVLGHVVAGRVVELRAHQLGSGRELRGAHRVEAQQVEGAGRIGDQNPGPGAVLLDSQYLPGGVDHRWLAVARASHQLFEDHAMAPVVMWKTAKKIAADLS